MNIKIKRIKNGILPQYKTEGSSGADCFARIDEVIRLLPNKRETIPLGFAVEIPKGYELQIRGRSGLAKRNGLLVFEGTIDSDYRGEVSVILINTSDDIIEIHRDYRIAQAVISPVIKANWNEVDELSKTERDIGGFGSTGLAK
jgi:dUTP pyrophosphatase